MWFQYKTRRAFIDIRMSDNTGFFFFLVGVFCCFVVLQTLTVHILDIGGLWISGQISKPKKKHTKKQNEQQHTYCRHLYSCLNMSLKRPLFLCIEPGGNWSYHRQSIAIHLSGCMQAGFDPDPSSCILSRQILQRRAGERYCNDSICLSVWLSLRLHVLSRLQDAANT